MKRAFGTPPERGRQALRRMWRKHRLFMVLLTLFGMGAVVYQRSFPFMEGVDEDLHFNYVNYLRNENQLPDRLTVLSNTMRQESGQPPLTYWVAARFLDLLRLPRYTGDVRVDLQALRNSWAYPVTDANTPETQRRTDNHNVYYHEAVAQALRHPEIITFDLAARLPSVLFALLAVIGCYGAAREVFGRTQWVMVATALFMFMPQFLSMTALLTNDISATAFATLTIWATLRLLRNGTSPLRLLILGVLIGLCGLSKINALVVVPGVGLAIGFDGRNRHLAGRYILVNAAIVGLAGFVVLGPWLVYGLLSAGDPLGVNTHAIFESTLPTVNQFLAYLPTLYESYWGKLDALEFSPLTYLLFTGLLLLAITGFGMFLASRRPRIGSGHVWQQATQYATQQAVILATVIALALALTLVWLVRLFSVATSITGRLMYPSHAAVAIALTAGLALFANRLPRYAAAIRLYAVGLVIPAGLFLGPLSFAAVYGPPRTSPDLTALHSVPIDFDHTIRLLGYRQADPYIHDGQFHTVTLCWQVLRPPARTAAFALKIFDTNTPAMLVGTRTSVPGLGHYPAELWKMGDTFCDDVDVLITEPLQPAHTYNVVVVMVDDFTKAADWQATGPDGSPISLPVIAQVVAPAGIMVADHLIQRPIVFPNYAALNGYKVDQPPAPGTTLSLELAWNVTGHTSENWSQFIHLVGPNQEIRLVDGIPRAGDYPTWAWAVGEQITDDWQLTIPANLAPGDYTITLGFSTPTARMPVTIDGQFPPNQEAPLLTFHVP